MIKALDFQIVESSSSTDSCTASKRVCDGAFPSKIDEEENKHLSDLFPPAFSILATKRLSTQKSKLSIIFHPQFYFWMGTTILAAHESTQKIYCELLRMSIGPLPKTWIVPLNYYYGWTMMSNSNYVVQKYCSQNIISLSSTVD